MLNSVLGSKKIIDISKTEPITFQPLVQSNLTVQRCGHLIDAAIINIGKQQENHEKRELENRTLEKL